MLRSEVSERLHRDRAPAMPQGLVPAAVLRAPLCQAAGEPEPALPLRAQHPARRRSALSRDMKLNRTSRPVGKEEPDLRSH